MNAPAVLRYTVPVRPLGVNEMYRSIPGGRRAKSREGEAFCTALAAYGGQARRAAHYAMIPSPDRVDVLITLYFHDRRPDVDGPLKPILDSLQVTRAHRLAVHRHVGAGVIENDRQVNLLAVRPLVDEKHPRIEIAVGPAGYVFTLTELAEGTG